MDRKDKVSHQSIMRPLDYLYDSTYTVSSEKSFYKMAARAANQIGEKDIRPHFKSMFSDISRYPRVQCVYKMENIPLTRIHTPRNTFQNETVNGRNMVQYVARSTSDVLDKLRLEQLQTPAHTVCMNGIHEETTSAKENTTKTLLAKRRTVCTRGTQTDYRDSETQTDIRIPLCSFVDGDISDIFCYLPESGETGETNVLDDKHRILDLEQKLSNSKKNLNAQIAITKQIQRIKWLIKEKRIDYVNEIRMQFAENTLSEHKLQIQTTVTQREVTRAHAHEMLTNQKLQSLRMKKERGLYRRLSAKRNTKNLPSNTDDTVYVDDFGLDLKFAATECCYRISSSTAQFITT